MYAPGSPCCSCCSPQQVMPPRCWKKRNPERWTEFWSAKPGLFHIIGGKWLGIFLLGCLQISGDVCVGGNDLQDSAGEALDRICVMTFSTAAATASFAMLMATICKSRAQLNAVSVVIILSMSAVGGSMIPRFAMSDRMKEIGKWTFNAWALDGYQKVFWFQSPRIQFAERKSQCCWEAHLFLVCWHWYFPVAGSEGDSKGEFMKRINPVVVLLVIIGLASGFLLLQDSMLPRTVGSGWRQNVSPSTKATVAVSSSKAATLLREDIVLAEGPDSKTELVNAGGSVTVASADIRSC